MSVDRDMILFVIPFTGCEKNELLNTFTQNTIQNLKLTLSISTFRTSLDPKTHCKTFDWPHWSWLFMVHLSQNTHSNTITHTPKPSTRPANVNLSWRIWTRTHILIRSPTLQNYQFPSLISTFHDASDPEPQSKTIKQLHFTSST